ncbi:hypothetical protein [Nocardia sp. CA-290969]|uniref:hypothetical protein n=1 Tax=Nocardia sp. CA-290969 TaxID=3239986 RepID=UPI003D8B8706
MTDQTPAEQLAEILHKQGAYCGGCDYESRCPDCDKVLDSYAVAILAAGWRPPTRVITDPAELDALPAGSVVMDSPYPEGDVYRRTSDGAWEEPGFDATCTSRSLSLPVVVLHTPQNGETE